MSNYIVVLTVIPLKAKRQKGSFDLFDEISKIFSNNKILLENGDVIVISSKYVANSQGRICLLYTSPRPRD